MRTRIALTTAMAVIAVPLFLFTMFASSPAASAPGNRTTDLARGAQDVPMKLMSYDQARQAAQLVAYAQAVEAYKVKTYLEEVAYLKAMAERSATTIPAAWMPTALCEEGGRNDPVAGYFGIKEWNGFGGYPTAGSAPLSVQLAWEATYIGGPPDAPGQCHSY